MTVKYGVRLVVRKWHDEKQTLRSLLEHLRYAGVLSYEDSLDDALVVEMELPGPKKWLDQVVERVASFGDRLAILKRRRVVLGQSSIPEIRRKAEVRRKAEEGS